jgi:hypothetical protein
VAFWIDYSCVDQSNPRPSIEALPLYVAACPVLAAYSTTDYDTRAWTMLERVVSYAYSDTAIPIRISGGFLHRRQSPTVEQHVILDPKDGQLTKEEEDRPLVDALCRIATESCSVELAVTRVPTLCLANDDDLPEITPYQAYAALSRVADSVLVCSCCQCCLPGCLPGWVKASEQGDGVGNAAGNTEADQLGGEVEMALLGDSAQGEAAHGAGNSRDESVSTRMLT